MAMNLLPPGYTCEIVHEVPFTILSRYKINRRIGVGAQGVVVSAEDKENNEKVAIKKFLKGFTSDPNAKRTFREIFLMKNLKHPNIISLLNIFTPNPDPINLEEVYVVMDLCKYNLSILLKKLESPLDHQTLQGMTYQMLCAVHYMHLCGVAHRDMKPSNIVVKFTQSGQVDCLKILDFGLARTMLVDDNISSPNAIPTPYVVTRYYRAPEIIVGMNYGCQVDVWSIGCILAELILSVPLMKGYDYVDQWNKVCEVRGTPNDAYLNSLAETVSTYCKKRPRFSKIDMKLLLPDSRFVGESDELNKLARSLVESLLTIPVEERITTSQAIKHDYLSSWYKESDLNPPHQILNEEVWDSDKYTKKEWKERVWKEIHEFQPQEDMNVSSNHVDSSTI